MTQTKSLQQINSQLKGSGWQAYETDDGPILRLGWIDRLRIWVNNTIFHRIGLSRYLLVVTVGAVAGTKMEIVHTVFSEADRLERLNIDK